MTKKFLLVATDKAEQFRMMAGTKSRGFFQSTVGFGDFLPERYSQHQADDKGV